MWLANNLHIILDDQLVLWALQSHCLGPRRRGVLGGAWRQVLYGTFLSPIFFLSELCRL